MGLKMTTIVSKSWVLAAPLVLMAAIAWFAGLPVTHAQQLPAHVYAGVAIINGKPAPNGTTVSAWIDGNVVAKTTFEAGKYTLTVEQPRGKSYA